MFAPIIGILCRLPTAVGNYFHLYSGLSSLKQQEPAVFRPSASATLRSIKQPLVVAAPVPTTAAASLRSIKSTSIAEVPVTAAADQWSIKQAQTAVMPIRLTGGGV